MFKFPEIACSVQSRNMEIGCTLFFNFKSDKESNFAQQQLVFWPSTVVL